MSFDRADHMPLLEIAYLLYLGIGSILTTVNA